MRLLLQNQAMRQVLQSTSSITKCDRLLLQSASGIVRFDSFLLQSVSVITSVTLITM